MMNTTGLKKLGATLTLTMALAVAGNAEEAKTAPVPAAPVADGGAGVESTADFLDNSPEALGAVVSKAKGSAEKYLAAKGWHPGVNSDGKYVAIGEGPIDAAPTDRDFQLKRVNAFQRAMLNAKEEIAKYYAQNIRVEVLSKYSTTSGAARQVQWEAAAENNTGASIAAKLNLLLAAKLDKALAAEGVPVNSPSAGKRAGELLNSDLFSQLVERTARATVSGLICSKIYEEDRHVAVAAYYSPSTRLLANALRGGGAAPAATPRQGPLGAWVGALTPAELYPSFGVQLAADERGNIVILSYGQMPAQSDSKLAVRNARTSAEALADGYLRQFAGEQVAFYNLTNVLESSREFDDGTADKLAGEASETKIRAVAAGLNISGIQTLRQWETKDTRGGKIIVGTVRAWTLQSSREAKAAAAGKVLPAAKSPSAGGEAKSYRQEGLESQDF
ncbi:MAG: hypothetical protein LBK60_01180 [Verrucomicrobiales bacterium]|jgi:hypothetical protein|nr:hypothetical protein [Verrucomicrobiales bacterium]